MNNVTKVVVVVNEGDVESIQPFDSEGNVVGGLSLELHAYHSKDVMGKLEEHECIDIRTDENGERYTFEEMENNEW